MLADNTLQKTACHFLLRLVGFDTLTYRKEYARPPTLVGHQIPSSTVPIQPGLIAIESCECASP